MRLATQALNGKTEFTPQVREVQAAQIPHFHILPVVPDPFTGVQVRRIGRKLLQMNLPCSTFRQNRAHMFRRPSFQVLGKPYFRSMYGV